LGHAAHDPAAIWVFGYGSLIWKPDFEHTARLPCVLPGWKRRFWQHSPDHRGTPEEPGRVVTLLPDSAAETVGVAYRLAATSTQHVLKALDHREKAGYSREMVQVRALESADTVSALVYVATEFNTDFAGPASAAEIAKLVQIRVGPSGTNKDYVLRLQRALAELGHIDPHVDAIVAHLSVSRGLS
jgi:glutathione-specific gamma-glutamylcyclotransferase